MARPSPRPKLGSDERGMALVLALLGIIVIGALVAGTFTSGRLEMTSGRNVVYSAQAAEAAEAGLNDAFVNWSSSWNGLALLTPTAYSTPSDVIPGESNGVTYSRRVTRLAGNVFLVESEGQRIGPSGQVLASRTLGRLARTDPVDLDVQAAVTANDVVDVAGTAIVSGVNTVPDGWDDACPVVDDTVYGVRTSGTVDQRGNSTIIGSPDPTSPNDPSVTAASIAGPFAQFAAMASPSHTFGGGSITKSELYPRLTGSPTTCDTSHPNNWGEPYRDGMTGYQSDCETFMPIVYYTGTGTLTINGGGNGAATRRGAGIILSAGNIWIDGGFEFTGIVIAMGSVTIKGNGTKVTGAILSANANLADDLIEGTPEILYSSCVIANVLGGVSRGAPLASRNWVQRWQ